MPGRRNRKQNYINPAVPKVDNLYRVGREAICEAQKPKRRRIDWRRVWEMFIGGVGFAGGVFTVMVIVFYLLGGVIR